MEETPLDSFVEILNSISQRDFERLIFELLNETDRYSNLIQEAELGVARVDILGHLVGNHRQAVAFEVKRVPLARIDLIQNEVGRREILRKTDKSIQLILIVAGNLTQGAREAAQQLQLEVWDATTIRSLMSPFFAERWLKHEKVDTSRITPRSQVSKSHSLIRSLSKR